MLKWKLPSRRYYVGCSGWSYNHWWGKFYAKTTNPGNWLEEYAKTFKSVEVNSSAYEWPMLERVRGWRKRVPASFVFALKCPRSMTHESHLRNHDELKRLLELRHALGPGPILFVLSAACCEAGDVEQFVEWLPEDGMFAFEFRRGVWPNRILFHRPHLAVVASDYDGYEVGLHQVGGFVYYRFHGPDRQKNPGVRYTSGELHAVSDLLRLEKRVSFAYFNNDWGCAAPYDAVELCNQLQEESK